jgi:hypothetical protein
MAAIRNVPDELHLRRAVRLSLELVFDVANEQLN